MRKLERTFGVRDSFPIGQMRAGIALTARDFCDIDVEYFRLLDSKPAANAIGPDPEGEGGSILEARGRLHPDCL